MDSKTEYSVPKSLQATYEAIVSVTDAVCRERLNDEYADLARRLAAKLSRKRPSPLESGQPKSWAGGILYTLGRINFLFDRDQKPHLSARELCAAIGVSQGTATSKSNEIMDMMRLFQLHPDWTLPSMVDRNPLAWMISVNGFLVDARYAPREIQEEAFRLGLIPYLPG